MKNRLIAALATPLLVLAACTPQTTTTGTSSPTVAPSTTASATGSPSSKYVELQIPVPQANAKAGLNGAGWSVDIVAKGNGPAMDRIQPSFGSSSGAGRHTSFPGLVVMLSTTPNAQGLAGPKQNLAKLFQIVALENTNPQVARTTSTASPTATATGSPTGTVAGATSTPAGATTTTPSDTTTAEATWFVQNAMFGSDVDVEVTAFVVEGDAPDVVNDQQSLKIVSNEVRMRFHINGGAGTTSTGSPRATATGTATASPTGTAGGTGASPTASPSKTP
jgi:hypothetical protein